MRKKSLFSHLSKTECKKKTSRLNARLINTINKNNNKDNNKKKDMITKDIIYGSVYNIFVITIAFKGFLLSETLLSNISKIFLFYALMISLPV